MIITKNERAQHSFSLHYSWNWYLQAIELSLRQILLDTGEIKFYTIYPQPKFASTQGSLFVKNSKHPLLNPKILTLLGQKSITAAFLQGDSISLHSLASVILNTLHVLVLQINSLLWSRTALSPAGWPVSWQCWVCSWMFPRQWISQTPWSCCTESSPRHQSPLSWLYPGLSGA